MPDWNADLFVKLYSKMALALGVTPGSNKSEDSEMLEIFGGQMPPRPGGVFGAKESTQYLLAIYNPGQYIPSGMDPLSNEDDSYALSVLFDVVPQFSWVFKPAAAAVSDAYRSILDGKEVPLTSLTPDQAKKLEDAVAYYDEYHSDYETYMDQYLVVLDAYNSALATELNGGPKVPRSLKEKLKAAYGRWVAHHKAGVESAIAVIAQYEALEPEAFWYQLRTRFDAGTRTESGGSEFQVVGFSPPYKSWFGDAGWTKFSFDQKDMDNQSRSEAIGVAGGLDLEFGIFKISGSGDYHEDSSYQKMDQTKLQFSCELMRVSLDRSWMNPLLLFSRAWRWAKESPYFGVQFSSGGDIQGDVPPTGTMTVIPTAAILSRNLRIDGAFDNTVVEELNRKIQAEASVGIGPFAISGRFNMEHHQGSERGSLATNAIVADDVQIVALICEMLPECPDPDETLPWP